MLVEIESVINARPITYVYDDEESISYPLTPSELIYGRRITCTPNASHYEIVSTNQPLTRKARHHKHVLRQLTKQWRKEYLTSLREQSSVGNKGNGAREISIGDIVLLKLDSTTRCYWKLAKVEELISGNDGKIRAAVVKVASSDKRPVYLRRVVQHLIPIEVKADNKVTQPPAPQATVDETVRENGRPRRNAAVIGEISRRDMQNIV